MRRGISILLMYLLLFTIFGKAQTSPLDKVKFFAEDKMVKATLVTNLGKMLNGRMKAGDSVSSSFTFHFDDLPISTEKIFVEIRGNFRRKNCIIPPLRLNFKSPQSSTYSSLGSLKLVSSCRPSDEYNQYVLIEYLIYKIYNLFTEKSFRVRLLELTYKDSSGRKKDIKENAFLLEDVKDMAKRNNMVEWKKWKVLTEQTNREQMTMVAIFEYMIGNTDWSVPVTHNIRLIYQKETQKDFPYPVPYDFDYCGLVNADYAVPYEMLNLENIRQRLYRGYPRTMEELTKTLDIFREKKEKIYTLINGFELLNASKRRDMIKYLDSFYETINDSREVNSIFIKNARND
ncbi:MAG: hypothetical protein ACM3H8_13310 [Sphingobacteriales bacterium]